MNEEELIREHMEDRLIKGREQGDCKEWKFPAVKAMNPQAFEGRL
jgi:hypothetical protein